MGKNVNDTIVGVRCAGCCMALLLDPVTRAASCVLFTEQSKLFAIFCYFRHFLVIPVTTGDRAKANRCIFRHRELGGFAKRIWAVALLPPRSTYLHRLSWNWTLLWICEILISTCQFLQYWNGPYLGWTCITLRWSLSTDHIIPPKFGTFWGITPGYQSHWSVCLTATGFRTFQWNAFSSAA